MLTFVVDPPKQLGVSGLTPAEVLRPEPLAVCVHDVKGGKPTF